MKREDVYKLIDGEREYQDNLPPCRTDGSDKTVGDYLTMLQSYLTKAQQLGQIIITILLPLMLFERLPELQYTVWKIMEHHQDKLRQW